MSEMQSISEHAQESSILDMKLNIKIAEFFFSKAILFDLKEVKIKWQR